MPRARRSRSGPDRVEDGDDRQAQRATTASDRRRPAVHRDGEQRDEHAAIAAATEKRAERQRSATATPTGHRRRSQSARHATAPDDDVQPRPAHGGDGRDPSAMDGSGRSRAPNVTSSTRSRARGRSRGCRPASRGSMRRGRRAGSVEPASSAAGSSQRMLGRRRPVPSVGQATAADERADTDQSRARRSTQVVAGRRPRPQRALPAGRGAG